MTKGMMARQLAREGLNQPEIAEQLAIAGYVSPRTGEKYSQTAISAMLRRKRRRKKRDAASIAPPPRKPGGREGEPKKIPGKTLDALRSVLDLPGMSSADKVALAQLILG